MPEELVRITAFIRALSRRERALLALSGGMRVAAVPALPILVVLLGAITRSDPAATTGWAVLAGGLSALVALLPLGRGWARAGDGGRQASLVESQLPGLEGRLVTTHAAAARPQASVSPAILAFAAENALSRLSRVSAADVHPAAPAMRAAMWAALAWFTTGAAVASFPGGTLALAAWWAGVATPIAQIAAVDAQAPVAEIGDLTIRYVYPAYTGLDPYEVPNSSGEVHAPPGTTVELRAKNAETVTAAALWVGPAGAEPDGPGTENLEASVEADGRWVKASFVVPAAPAEWRLNLFIAGQSSATAPFPVLPEPDLPPEVLLDGLGERLELDIDDAIDLKFSARDDYGVAKVRLEVDGRPATSDLWTAAGRSPTASGSWHGTPLDLGLKPGDAVELRVAAFDNDAVSGSKKGTSRPVKLLIKGGAPKSLTPEDQEALIALLVDALAGHLEEPWPAGTRSADFARWGEGLGKRYDALLRFHEERGDVAALGMLELAMLADALDRATETIRFTQVSFFSGDTSTPAADTLASVEELRAKMIASVEEAILAIDAVRVTAAYTRIEKGLPRMERIAEDLREALAESKIDGSRVADAIADLSVESERARAAAAILRPGGMQELVFGRVQEMSRLAARASEAIQRRDDAESRRLSSRLAGQISDYVAVVKDMFARARKQRESLGQKMKDVIAELKEIEAAERLIATQTRAAREATDKTKAAAATSLWKEAERAADRLTSATGAWVDGLERASRPFDERTLGSSADERAEASRSSVQNRDLLGAWRNAQSVAMSWEQVARRYTLQYGGRAPSGPGSREIGSVNAQIEALMQVLLRIDQADQESAAGGGAAVAPLLPEQQTLTRRFEGASRKARELAKEYPVTPSGLDEALDLGMERMKEAESNLTQGKAMAAEGSESAAAGHVRDAIEALQRAQQQAARQQRQGEAAGRGAGSGSGSGSGSGGEEEGEGGEEESEQGQGEEDPEGEDGGGDEDGEGHRSREIELPSPEEFRTPEEYRQSLLEGMTGDVPDAYRALKKRYYEELVQQ
jgi:hypothetical protein